MAKNSITIILTDAQSQKLKTLLSSRSSYQELNIPYAEFAFKGDNVHIALYSQKNKLLIQGAGTENFITFTLEPEITGILETSTSLPAEHIPSLDYPHFGSDESGKGDYLGPLVIAGVYTTPAMYASLQKAGVTDSKAISTPTKIRQLATIIRQTPGLVSETLCLSPQRYNALYTEHKNLNTLLAWAHARVIAGLLAQQPDCQQALVDQFAYPYVLLSALKKQQVQIHLKQRPRAESDIAVAAASILAREHFINWMDKASTASGITLPLGASTAVITAAKKIVAQFGPEMLPKVAKIHFKSTLKVLPPTSLL